MQLDVGRVVEENAHCPPAVMLVIAPILVVIHVHSVDSAIHPPAGEVTAILSVSAAVASCVPAFSAVAIWVAVCV